MQDSHTYRNDIAERLNPPGHSLHVHPSPGLETSCAEDLESAFWKLESTDEWSGNSLPRDASLPPSFRVSKRWGTPAESGVRAV